MQMNYDLLKKKMDHFFDSHSGEEIMKMFESRGMRFVKIKHGHIRRNWRKRNRLSSNHDENKFDPRIPVDGPTLAGRE